MRAKREPADTLGHAAVGRSRRDVIDATRALRSALHGFVTLETSGGSGLPVDIDRNFERLVRGLEAAMSGCTAEPISTSGPT